jgi:superfamily II DNA or RNA helicase
VQSGLAPGDVVHVRGRSWILQSLTSHADCGELELQPADDVDGRTAPFDAPVVLLTPFDRPAKLTAARTVRVVTRRAWVAALRHAVLSQREPGSLVAPAKAIVDLLPHQLEPVLAVMRHGIGRLLLADGVGLGKTIEAGLVLAELRARGGLERALVLTPPGLRDQWSAELRDRFAIDAVVADAAWLRATRASLPGSVNPWSVPGVFVASVDFVKRPEVRRGLQEVAWDAFVLDEAHLAAGDSERRAAAHAIASRAGLVLLLTATPHSGDQRTFEALCRIGALSADDPIAVFRRNRDEAGLARTRRVHLHRVRSTPAEEAVRRALRDYVGRVWVRQAGQDGRHARLAMVVLVKRSLSGMAPLRQSLSARLSRLGHPDTPSAAQLPLPWEDETDGADEAPSDVLAAAGLEDGAEERDLLAALVERARAAEQHDSKVRALRRLIRRAREPVIVFTEYRDTIASLETAVGEDVAVLHGALDRFERSEVLQRFTRGDVRVLLATDAAGEGLNLQQRCRLVVNLELPWNPMRLEQRIGRVDRIGQSRTVHAVNLVAGGTAESHLLARLVQRLDLAQAAMGPMDEVLGQSDDQVVLCHLGLESAAPWTARTPPSAGPASMPPSVRKVDMSGEARALVARLEVLRDLWHASSRAGHRGVGLIRRRARTGVPVTEIRGGRLPAPLRRPGALAIFRVRSPGPGGRETANALVPVLVAGSTSPTRGMRQLRARADAFITGSAPLLAQAVQALGAARQVTETPSNRGVRLARRAATHTLVQAGLFDRRAEREAERRAGHAAAAHVARAADNEAGGCAETGARASDPQLELLMFITS